MENIRSVATIFAEFLGLTMVILGLTLVILGAFDLSDFIIASIICSTTFTVVSLITDPL